MTNFIPIFPLNLVVYPGEELKLHIFEPRYKQMVNECIAEQKPFGIPDVIEKKLKDFGTSMEIIARDKVYKNGEMDIRVKGIAVFRMLKVIHQVPDKLYSGAIVNYPHNKSNGNAALMKTIVKSILQLHKLMKIKDIVQKTDGPLCTYDVAHEAGLSIIQEYEMLCLFEELQRQEYLRRHLKKIILLMDGLEHLRERSRLNGHYRHLSTGDF